MRAAALLLCQIGRTQIVNIRLGKVLAERALNLRQIGSPLTAKVLGQVRRAVRSRMVGTLRVRLSPSLLP